MINLNDILTDANVQNALYTIITVIAGLIYKKYKEFDKDRKLEKVAYDAWHIVEEYFRLNPAAKQSAQDKVDYFESLIRKKFPKVTKEQLDWLNKSIAGMMNSNNCTSTETIQTNNSPLETVTIEPKYYTADGKELVVKEVK